MSVKYNPEQKKRVTLAQIAEVAGVSKSAVSYVLSEKPSNVIISKATRQRIADAARQLGYRPNAAAKSLATGRTQIILLAIFQTVFDENLYACRLGAERYLAEQGYSLQICTIDSDGKYDTYANIIRSGGVDGVLHVGSADPDLVPASHRIREIANEAGVPVWAFENELPADSQEYYVDADHESVGKLATSHLLEHGHKRILFVGVRDQRWSISRMQGYEAALESAGVAVSPDLEVILEEHDQQVAYDTVLKVARSKDFTAMFIISDKMAMAALLALKTSGMKVPQDCAIVSCDDIETLVSYSDPPLTSVSIPCIELGREAAKSLIMIMDGKTVSPVLLPVSLSIRESCGCKPAGLKGRGPQSSALL